MKRIKPSEYSTASLVHVLCQERIQNGDILPAGHNDVFSTHIVMPTRDGGDGADAIPLVTLISLHPYLIDNHRIVATDVLQGPQEQLLNGIRH